MSAKDACGLCGYHGRGEQAMKGGVMFQSDRIGGDDHAGHGPPWSENPAGENGDQVV